MPVIDFVSSLLGGISVAQGVTLLSLLVWLVSGGFIWILRHLSFFVDKSLVGIMASVYNVFETLLSGKMFNDDVVTSVLRNVYVFVGVIVFFRLVMVLMRYLMNPELTSDDRAGVNSLVKRVIIGSMGILFIPMLFNLMNDFQAGIISDQVVQQIIIPKNMIAASKRMHEQGGRFLGSYVLSGFLNPNPNAAEDSIDAYNMALQRGDLTSINLNKGKVLGNLFGTYEYEYMIIVSTLVLAYTLFLLLDYALDVTYRFFKLFLYQIIAPIAMIEYMISGSEAGMFQAWRKGVLSSYLMLFTRMLSIWFVIFIITLMGDDSLNVGTLLANKDYLLRALIIIAALAFMKDLPKIIGELFGLDFEQASSAKEIANGVKGMIKGAGMVGLGAAGGLAAGAVGAVGAAKDVAKNSGLKGRALGQAMGKASNQAMKPALKNVGSGLLGSNAATKAFVGGYSGAQDSVKKTQDKAELQEAIKNKRDNMDKGTTEASRIVNALQEVELRVAGEKLSDANRVSGLSGDNKTQVQAQVAVGDVASRISVDMQQRLEAKLPGDMLSAIQSKSSATPEDIALNQMADDSTNSIIKQDTHTVVQSAGVKQSGSGSSVTYDVSTPDAFEQIASELSSSSGGTINAGVLRGQVTTELSLRGISESSVSGAVLEDIISSAPAVTAEYETIRNTVVANEIVRQVTSIENSVSTVQNIGDIQTATEETLYVAEDIKQNVNVIKDTTLNIDKNVEDIQVATEETLYVADEINQKTTVIRDTNVNIEKSSQETATNTKNINDKL